MRRIFLLLCALLLPACPAGEDRELQAVGPVVESIEVHWDRVREPLEPQLLTRSPAPAELQIPGAVVESWEVAGPAGYRVEALLARPEGGSDLPCAVVSGRALHDNVQTLEQVRPLLDLGHAVLVCEVFRGELPAEVENWVIGERDLWRRERAARALEACFELLKAEGWCDPGQRWFLGFSRGSSLILPAAVRRPDTRLVVLVSPVKWLPPGRIREDVPEERVDRVRRLVRPLLPVACAQVLKGEVPMAAAYGLDDRNWKDVQAVLEPLGGQCRSFGLEGAGHVFDFSVALDAGLAEWIERSLGEEWEPPATPRDVFGLSDPNGEMRAAEGD